jgi:hypothetical protein
MQLPTEPISVALAGERDRLRARELIRDHPRPDRRAALA